MATGDHDFVVLGDEDLGGYNAAGILPESLETIQKIQQWLKPTDFAADSSEYKKHLNSYVVGTGNWIQQTDIYQKWHSSPESSSLWIKAIPGGGKSVFAAMIADKLAHTEKVPVLYFFFRQIIAKNHDPQYLVRDWLSQLLPYSPYLQSELKRKMEDNLDLHDISTDEFWHSLIQAIESIPKLYCVVDALDEMDISQLDFLDRLVELGKQKHSAVKVLMTSRPLSSIESKLRRPSILEISILQIRLQQDMVDTDIAIYVNHRLREHGDPSLTDDVREAIRNAICTKGQGSFLYARLMMDKLLDGTTQISSRAADAEEIMKKLPTSLEDMYNGMLLDHAARSGVPQQLQLTILQWVTHSVRPLRLLELTAIIDSLEDGKRNSKDTKALVRTACGPLLEILEDETVSIIHHSFTEFLVDEQGKK